MKEFTKRELMQLARLAIKLEETLNEDLVNDPDWDDDLETGGNGYRTVRYHVNEHVTPQKVTFTICDEPLVKVKESKGEQK